MQTVTWVPGSRPDLDELFHELREQHYQNHAHRLWRNYSAENFAEALAFTIYWDDAGLPEMCSSITKRSCWPNQAYRIMNRTWKVRNHKAILRRVSDCVGYSVISQIEWLQQNTDMQLCFISRQVEHDTEQWDRWVLDNFQTRFNVPMQTSPHRYLTCPDPANDSCWQKIYYVGDGSLLANWSHR